MWQRIRARLAALRFDLGEASGALGDLGTFVPIVSSLVAAQQLKIGPVLLFAGLANILTGLAFNQPIPVQPMKAIAAVALTEALSPGAIAAAGFGAGVIVFLLGATGAVLWLEKRVPRMVVRGIELGVGLKLLVKGLLMVGVTAHFGLDSWATAALAAALVLTTSLQPRFPSALVLFVIGLVLLYWLPAGRATAPTAAWVDGGLSLVWPSAIEWRDGLLRGTLPQLPLTVLNSVLAVCALSESFFPGRGISGRRMSVSVGLMNMISVPFGAMPMCHGAGGLAGQHRFGGRTGGSVIMLGLAKVLLALALGGTAAALLARYPASILGVLLAFAGAGFALPARDATERDDFFVVVITAGGTLGANTLVGVLLGLFTAALFWLRRPTH